LNYSNPAIAPLEPHHQQNLLADSKVGFLFIGGNRTTAPLNRERPPWAQCRMPRTARDGLRELKQDAFARNDSASRIRNEKWGFPFSA